MSSASSPLAGLSPSELMDLLASQRAAFADAPYPSLAERIRKLDRLHNAIIDHKDAIIAAVDQDFGGRSTAETLMAEIFPLLEGIAYCRKNLKRWMKPQRRAVPLILAPASATVHAQPLGVVGIVVPWNFPVFLGLSPLTYALAAGNRVMMKMSEFAPETGKVIAEILCSVFSDDEVAVVNGDVETATAFTQLPFDHLVFTGSTNTGRVVARAAADNLTPLTLELGGKSPAIIHPDFPLKEAARRIAFGKSINAGQVCVSPDYILCRKNQVNDFAKAFIDEIATNYPEIGGNSDYTSIINERQLGRLRQYIADAEAKGAAVLTINPKGEELSGSSKLPMTVVIDVNDDMLVMQEEIFGPILPIVAYDDIDEAVAYVNSKPRPLALYYFDWSDRRAKDVINGTHSGGVCINDTMSHVMTDDIPFGGVGPSGVGHYHGKEGFETFSNLKGVVSKGRINSTAFVGAPWDRPIFRSLTAMQWLRFRRRPS